MANNNTTTSVHTKDVARNRPSSFDAQSITDPASAMRADELAAIAQRLLSETAHDLQSPLMAVRESVRAVNEGELGQTTDEQRSVLLGAIHCCSDMQVLIDNMLQLESLRNGMPRVHRQWVDAAIMIESVFSMIASAGIDQNVTILWDGRTSGHHLLYADADKLRRLLLNLLRNAIRATPNGGQVLIRTQRIEDRGTYRFSVIDRGCGMEPDALRRLAARGSSTCGGAGLGLAISRQMASLHFANLEITSRPGVGTRVGFEIPSGGPSAVADSWCRWRNLFRSSHKRPLRRGIYLADTVEDCNVNGVFGQDGDFNDSLALTHEGPAPQHPDSTTVLSLQLAESTPIELATRLDERLQEGLRMYELAYRAAERRWIVLWDTDRIQAMDRIASTNRSIAAALPSIQLSWSNAIPLPVGARSTRARIRDLLVRDTLGAGSETPIGDDRRMTIRNATASSAAPAAVAQRLDHEMRRLTGRLGGQRTLMQQQATAIRPPQSRGSREDSRPVASLK